MNHYKNPGQSLGPQTGWTIWGWIVGVIIILNEVYFL
jgi:hypothetical protein